jgi:hypothetical protein
MADGEIFNTITNGKNTMMSYRGNVPGGGPVGDNCLRARFASAARTPPAAMFPR